MRNLNGPRIPPVVFLHGFLGQAEDWDAVVAGLSAGGQECIAIDLPGHGQTSTAAGKLRSLILTSESGGPYLC